MKTIILEDLKSFAELMKPTHWAFPY